MRVLECVLCLLVAAPFARGNESPELDPSLPSYRPVAGVIGVLRSHSTATIDDLMRLWGAGFERTYPDVRVELDDAPLDGAAGGACTFGPRVDIMGEPAATRFKARFGYAAMEIPVCLYVLGVFVNKDHPHERMTIEEVEASFSCLFRDLAWGDLGLEGVWSQRTIKPYAPSDHATSLLRHLPSGPGVFLYKDSVTQCSSDAAVVTSVADDALGLGLASIGRRTERVRVLPIAPKGSPDFVPATAENARDGSYPLTGTFYLILNHDPKGEFAPDPLRREFLRYILSKEGQQAVIKAGLVALSAEQAGQALARFGLRPTGEGSWEQMMPRLRERELPGAAMTRIEQLVRMLGDQPTREQLVALANMLGRTKLKSTVVFATDEVGATVRYRFLSQAAATPVREPASRVEADVPIGLYYVWTERDGKPTSPTDAWFPVVREQERIKVYEAR
jgi:phosphate transport system substrate-binding protein